MSAYLTSLPINFDEAVTGSDGIAYKAALQSLATDETGIGSGGSFQGGSSNWGFVGGGMQNISGDPQNAGTYFITNIAGIEGQRAMDQVMTLQFDVWIPDITSQVSINEANDLFVYPRDTGGGADFASGMYFTDAPVGNSKGHYRYLTEDKDGNDILTNPKCLKLSSGGDVIDNNDRGAILSLETANGGWCSINICKINDVYRWYFDGDLAFELTKENYDSVFEVDDWIFCHQLSPKIRNIIMSKKAMLPVEQGYPRAMCLGDSYAVESTAFRNRLPQEIHPTSTSQSQAVYTKGMFNQVVSEYPEHGFRMFGIGGRTTTQVLATINDAAEGTYKDPVSRYRPHFCFIVVGGNDVAGTEAAVAANVVAMCDALKAIKCIPIFIAQQAWTFASPSKDIVSNIDAAVAAVRALPYEVGVVDIRPALGGAVTGAKYVSNDGQLVHPSALAHQIYGIGNIAEYARLLASPPVYSRLYEEQNA